jgi:HAD superfamily hydrolase (TIGR01549 family)
VTISKIEGIIFDLGYTLIDYNETGWPEIRQTALQSGYSELKSANSDLPDFDTFVSIYHTKKEEYRESAFDSMLGWNIIDVVKGILKEFKVKDVSKYSRVFIETVYTIEQKQVIVDKNITKTLKELKNKKYKLGIISNTIYPAYLHENDITKFGWSDFFDFQIYSSQEKYRKPHPDIFRAGIKKMNLPSNRIMYVGDRYRMDALGAEKAGLVPVIRYCRKQSYPNIWPKNINLIQNISELPGLLKNFNR